MHKEKKEKYMEQFESNKEKIEENKNLVDWAKSFKEEWSEKEILGEYKKMGVQLSMNGGETGFETLRKLGGFFEILHSIGGENDRMKDQNNQIVKKLESEDQEQGLTL